MTREELERECSEWKEMAEIGEGAILMVTQLMRARERWRDRAEAAEQEARRAHERINAERATACEACESLRAVDTARVVAAERERDEARAKCAEWEEKAKAWMATPEAAARLDGYRELADRIAELEREREKARDEAKESAASDMDSLQRLRAIEPTLERVRIERGDAERARDEWKARAEKAERQILDVHDALHAQCDGQVDLATEVRALRAERDEARAEASRLADLHRRCEAFDDQPGPSCVAWKARAEKAEAALVEVRTRADACVSALQGIEGKDPEAAHSVADDLLLKCIADQRVSDAFEAVEKWYA